MSVSFITFFVCDFYVALLWHCEKNWNVWLAWKCSDNIEKNRKDRQWCQRRKTPETPVNSRKPPIIFYVVTEVLWGLPGPSLCDIIDGPHCIPISVNITISETLENFYRTVGKIIIRTTSRNLSSLFFCSNVHNSSESQSLILRFANQPNLRVGGVYGIALLLLLKEGN